MIKKFIISINNSFFFLISAELTKNIYFLIKESYYNIFAFIEFALKIFHSIFFAIYCLYIKRLMKYKFISPAKCNFIIGIINFPLIILIYFIISFTSLGNIENKYYIDNIFELFKNLGNIDIKNVIYLKFYFLDY